MRVTTACALAAACSDQEFSGCESTLTCDSGPGETQAGGQAGEPSAAGGPSDPGGAGEGGDGSRDTVSPKVVLVSPEDEATKVAVSSTIRVTFSEALDGETLTEKSFVVSGPLGSIAGDLELEGDVATFTPESSLALHGEYRVTLDDSITDRAGNALSDAPYTWSFETKDGAWGMPEDVESITGAATLPRVAIDARGNAVAVWRQGAHIRANTFSPETGWGSDQIIDENGNESHTVYGARVAMTAEGNAVAVWQQYDGVRNNIWANTYSVESGWGAADLVETDDSGSAEYPNVAFSDSGHAIAIFQYYVEDTNQRFIRANRFTWADRGNPSSGWGEAEDIDDDSDRSTYRGVGDIVMDGDGNAIASFSQSDEDGTNAWVNRYVAGEGWGEARLLPISENAGTPALAMNASGEAFAFVAIDGMPWAARFTVEDGWSEEVEDLGKGAIYASIPVAALDPRGNALVTWRENNDGTSNLWFNRFTPEDGWAEAALLDTSLSQSPDFPDLCVDPSGNVMAVWHQYDGTIQNAWYRRYRFGAGFGDTDLLETAEAGYANVVRVACAANGLAVAVWEQHDGTETSISGAYFH